MPDNPIPAAQSDSGEAAGELNFAKPPPENPRIKRRSLKAKKNASDKPQKSPSPAVQPSKTAAPAVAPEPAKATAPQPAADKPAPRAAAARPAENPATSRPPPAAAATAAAIATTAATATKPFQPLTGTTNPKIASTAVPSQTVSPHGTRPATLYYSSSTPRTKEASPMKPTPAPTPASSSASAVIPPTAATRTAPSSPRAAGPVDYRANAERQAREQKSVGSILAYVVYALIALFVLGGGLAVYGTSVLFQRISDQSHTVADLDQHYAQANKDLLAKLTSTQESLDVAQAQVNRQQDLISKEQESLNRLLSANSDSINALKLEKQARMQEETTLRARLRELEYRVTNITPTNTTSATTQKY
jgi:hypothetical protein